MTRRFVLGLIVAAGMGLWLVQGNRSEPEEGDADGIAVAAASRAPHRGAHVRGAPRQPAPAREAAVAGAVGTSGARLAHEGAAENETGHVVMEIETITGANDGMILVGRRVDLHVQVQAIATDRAFWVGSRDNRVLVVLDRDHHSGVRRRHSRSSHHNILTVRGGQRAAISGVVRPVPRPDERLTWKLTEAGERELADRKIYIRAETVRSEGHGTF